jgi:hypothetical protein
MSRSSLIYTIFFFTGLFFLCSVKQAVAVSTSSYEITPENAQNSTERDDTTSSYQLLRQQIGDPAAGPGSTSSYELRHGHLYPEPDEVQLSFTFLPEGRYGLPNTNNQTQVTIEVRAVGAPESSILSSQTVTTDATGSYTSLILTSISPGTYDITAKGWATLRQKKSSISLVAGANTVDFSDGGTASAKAGDINTFGRSSSPAATTEVGDNQIGAADYSTLVGNYQLPSVRFDLDAYEGTAAAADYSRLVSNYGAVGEP